MAQHADVLIIGGGVVGVCSAYYLAQEGREVTLVEKGEICSGCSYGNAGLVVPSHSMPLAAPGALLKGLKWMLNPESPFFIKPRISSDLLSWLWRFGRASNLTRAKRAMPVLSELGQASVGLYRELAAVEGLSFGYQQNGLLTVFRTEKELEESIRESHLLGEAGITAKVLDAAGARSMEPRLLPEIAGAVFFPHDAHLVPDLFVKGLARVAESMGVRLRPSTEVLGFKIRDRKVTAVETTRGEFTVDQVVLAAGSWSQEVGRALRLNLPIQPAKGYSLTFKSPRSGSEIPLLLGEARVAVTPMGEMLRFAGTLELAGLDLSVNRRRVTAIIRSISRYLDGLDTLPILEIWRGLRPCTPDGLPIIGRPRQLENVVLATGHAMIGVSLGPITGKLMSQLVTYREPMLDVSLLHPERFT